MSVLLWFPLVALGLAGYAGMGYITKAIVERWWPSQGREPEPLIAAFWPIALPIATGIHVAKKLVEEEADVT